MAAIDATLRKQCAGPGGEVGEGQVSADGTTSTTTYRRGPIITVRYVEGEDWFAGVGGDAPLQRVASVLGGRAVVRHCP